MFGLIVSAPLHDPRRKQLRQRLHDLDLPLTAFTEAPASLFTPDMPRAAFLRQASAALLQPGQPLPLDCLMNHISGPDPLPGNVLRKYLFLQLSLLPYLRPGRPFTQQDGCFLLGDALLIVPVKPDDTVDVLLPPGRWTELTGEIREGPLRCMRGYNEMPILVRQNTLLPIGVNDRATTHDDADRLTLHWFEPGEEAVCCLADGTRCHARRTGDHFRLETTSDKPWHLIVHQDGRELLVR